jgi:hypothetical protein
MWLLQVSVHHIQQNDTPDVIGCDAAVVEFIPTIRRVVYQEPHLKTKRRKETNNVPEGGNAGRELERRKERAKEERERRDEERRLLGELSRYYLRPEGKWPHVNLISRGKHRWFRYAHSNIQLTHPLTSCARFRSPPRSLGNFGRVGVDIGGSTIPIDICHCYRTSNDIFVLSNSWLPVCVVSLE